MKTAITKYNRLIIRNLLMLFYLATFTTLFSQERLQKDNCILCGYWKTVKKTDLEGSDGKNITITGSTFSTDYALKFDKDTLKLILNPHYSYRFRYKLKDSVISYHNEELYIRLLNKDSLVVAQYNDFGGYIYHMKREKSKK